MLNHPLFFYSFNLIQIRYSNHISNVLTLTLSKAQLPISSTHKHVQNAMQKREHHDVLV